MSLGLEIQTHQAGYAAGRDQTVYALLDFQPGPNGGRLPVDLRVVLDNSGSMGSEAGPGVTRTKLELCQEAVALLLDSLQPGDHLCLVRFDDSASKLWEGFIGVTASEKQKALKALKKLRPGGGTSILAGLTEALGEAPLPGYAARVVLVTDGEGNQHEEASCERMAFDLRGQATWLVYGTGVGYNDSFLDAVARANDGRYTHLASAVSAWDDFAAEAAVMGSVAVTGLTVTIEPVPGVELTRADRIVPEILPLPVHLPTYLAASLGEVDAVRGQKLLLQLAVSGQAAGKRAIARIQASYHLPARKLLDQKLDLMLEVEFGEGAGLLDQDVLRTVRLAGASRLATLGLGQAAGGQADAAIRTLNSAMGVYDDMGLTGASQQLRTLSRTLTSSGAIDEEAKRTLTTIARQAGRDPLAGSP